MNIFHFLSSTDAAACLLPEIPHAKVSRPDAWYPNGNRIRIKCDEGYKAKKTDATAVCRDGNWTSVPDCVSKCCTQAGKSATSLDLFVNKVKVICEYFS